jgi:hypothetical protein
MRVDSECDNGRVAEAFVDRNPIGSSINAFINSTVGSGINNLGLLRIYNEPSDRS